MPLVKDTLTDVGSDDQFFLMNYVNFCNTATFSSSNGFYSQIVALNHY